MSYPMLGRRLFVQLLETMKTYPLNTQLQVNALIALESLTQTDQATATLDHEKEILEGRDTEIEGLLSSGLTSVPDHGVHDAEGTAMVEEIVHECADGNCANLGCEPAPIAGPDVQAAAITASPPSRADLVGQAGARCMYPIHQKHPSVPRHAT